MIEEQIPQWRQELKSSQKKEGKSPSNRWIQMATITKNNQPRIRTVVFRGWLDNDSMLIFTDKRSQKIKDLEDNNNVEILWLFIKSKSQFRFKGQAFKIIDDISYWNNLTENVKDTWFWPKPGEPLSQNKLVIDTNKIEKPYNFSVFQIKIDSVDLLKLEKPIHKRYFWNKQDLWRRLEVNP